jgi:hypothetical protein
LRDRGSDKWAVRKNSANNFDIYGSAVGAPALTIFSSTNFVGIGTASPSVELEVAGSAKLTGTNLAIVPSTTTNPAYLVATNAGGNFFFGIDNNTGASFGAGTYGRVLYSSAAYPMSFFTNGAERLRITANGGISFGASGTAYGVSGQILQSNGDAAPTWISTGSLAAANATTATHLSGGVAGQIPYQTAPGVTAFLSTGTAGNVLVSNGSSAPTYNNTLTLTGTTAATSTTTGALQVVGGVGVGGDLFIRGDILTNDTTFNLINANATTVNFAGAATTLAMGASGSGTTNVRNNLTVSGNLTVQGTTTIVDSTVTNIADPIITLGGGTGNSAPTADDNKDRGVAFKWVSNAGTTSTGFFGYDDSTGYLTYVPTATITNEVVSGTKGAMDVNLAGGTAMSIVYQSAADTTAFLAATTSGYILQTNGTGSPPTWVSASGVSAGSATYADQIRTIAQTASASYYPTFVDSNNASNAYELVYTTSSFVINPQSGNVGIGTTSPGSKLEIKYGVQGALTLPLTLNPGFYQTGSATGIGFLTDGDTTYTKGALVYKSNATGWNIGDFQFLMRNDNNTNPVTLSDAVMTIYRNGNVGIGNTAPTYKLVVSTSVAASATTASSIALHLFNTATDGSSPPNQVGIGFGQSTTRSAIVAGTYGNDYIDFFNNGDIVTPKVRMAASGAIAFSGVGNYGSSGQILQSNGNAAPTWVSPGGITGVNADQVRTIAQTANASYFPAFVDSNNASNAYELVYTTSSFVINPQSGNVGIGTSTPSVKLHVVGASIIANNAGINPDSYANAVVAGAISFPSGWGVSSAVGGNGGGAGKSWAMGHNGTNFYMGMGNNSAADTQQTYIQMMPNRDLYLVPTSGNVGIGLTTLTEKFEVNGSINVSTASSNNFATGNQRGFMDYVPASTQVRVGHLSGASGSTTGILTLLTNGTERLRITAAGGISFGASGTAYGTSGQMLQSNGDAAPTWVALSSRTVGTSTQVNTVLQTGNTTYYPTFVDSNNAAAAAESLYTTSSFTVNAQSGSISMTGPLRTEFYGVDNSTPSDVLNIIGVGASRALGTGPAIVFSMPANTDGTNQWAQARIMGTGDNGSTGDANGAMYLQTRSLYNPGGGGSWNWRTNIVLRASGNVGVGTSSPATRLSATATRHANADGLSAHLNAIQWEVSGQGYTSVVSNISSSAGNYNAGLLVELGSTDATDKILDLESGGVNRVRVLGNGNVGIGTSTPNDKLQVQTSSATAYDATSDTGQYGSGAGITVTNMDETSQSFAQINLQVSGNSGRAVGRIVAIRTASATSDLAFVTENANTKAEKMRIFSNGNVSIGTTSTTNKFEVAGTAGQLFSVSDSFTGTIFSVNDISGIPSIEVLDTGLVKMAQYNGQLAIGTGTVASSTVTVSIYGMLQTMGTLGEIRASSEITAYYSSDRRLKENIKLIENPITIIDQIRGVTFDWTDEHMARRGGEDGFFVRKHDIGVIAQEVQAVLPELVGTREDGYLAVKYEKMVPLLIEAIKAQQKTIDLLVKDLVDVKEVIGQLKNKNGI